MIAEFQRSRGFAEYHETSAQTGVGCRRAARGDRPEHPLGRRLPGRLVAAIFKLLKDAILKLKDEGVYLLRMAELKQLLEMRLPGEPFTPDELRAVVGLLAGPGVVWRLEFGDFVLLQPERINAYAAAVVRSVRAHNDEIGVHPRGACPGGRPRYQDMKRLPPDEEEVVLRAMHQTLIDRGLCLREPSESGDLLVFPSYFKRETARAAGPSGRPRHVHVQWAAATRSTPRSSSGSTTPRPSSSDQPLAVRRRLQDPVRPARRPGDDPQAGRLGRDHRLFRSRRARRHQGDLHPIRPRAPEGQGPGRRPAPALHLPPLPDPVENRKTALDRLNRGLKDILCVDCGKRIPLWDLIEQKFASDEFKQRVRELERQAQVSIDNESRELILVGHAFAIAGEAGQIFRPTSNRTGASTARSSSRTLKGRPAASGSTCNSSPRTHM